ncbi:MAG: hypothetical protein JXA21_11085 [Anaerolineae bacterium]|nr:hypothetical protein [Anaerolineae bacterium]
MTARDTSAHSLGYGDYLRFSRLVGDLFGLHFPENRRTDLEQGIKQAFALSTCRDLTDYYHLLLDPDNGPLHRQRLVNALTIGESHFFRNANQFDVLYEQVLPEIIQRRRSLRTLRIWSAGCSEGQEPYSIAMLLRDLLPDVNEWAITILATDINTESLDRARRAIYSDWAFREQRAKFWQPRYFRTVGNRHELLPEVRRMVTFAQLNLTEDHYPSYQTNTMFMDIILCRNVTIYFTPSTTRQVIGRFYEALVDGGWLVVGHSEHSLATYSQFQALSYPNAILYRRTGKPTILPEDWDWLPAAPELAGAPSLRVPSGVATGSEALGNGAPPLVGDLSAAPAGEPSPEATLEHAAELVEYGHLDQARDMLLKLIERSSMRPEAAALLGQTYANQGMWRDGEHWCRQAIHENNLLMGPYYTLALILQHQGQLDDAIEMMKKVVYLDRTSIRGHYGLADLYHRKGALRQALKSLDNAHRALGGHSGNEVIPESGGITVERLREAITHQLQQWRAEASGVSV